MKTEKEPLRIETDFPGGNADVIGRFGNEVLIRPDLRRTMREWFYWHFRVRFSGPGTYTFRFAAANVMSRAGAAFRPQGKKEWRWLPESDFDTEQRFFRFTWREGDPDTVYFCVCIPYMPEDLESFLAEHPEVKKTTLCRTPKGREVPLLQLGSEGKRTLLLTSRHHACESPGTFVLEGILRYALSSPDFRAAYRILAAPFMDLDAVTDGEQGKYRYPLDQGSDYGDVQYFEETKALKALIFREKPDVILDLHAPYLVSGLNENFFLVSSYPVGSPGAARERRFAEHLEKHTGSSHGFRAGQLIKTGAGSNREDPSYGASGVPNAVIPRRGIGKFGASLPFTVLSCVFENSYALGDMGTKKLSVASWHSFGAGIAETLLELQDILADEEKA